MGRTSSTATGLVVPLGRQGRGRLPAAAVGRLDVGLRRRAGGVLAGEHAALGTGAGTELARLRPYEPGDDVRRLDPAASARTGVPHVRLQVPERTVTTWLVLDVSASMAFGTAARLKWDVADGVAEVVTRLAVRRGGRIAVLTAGEPTPRVLPPRGGRGALAAVRRLVAEGVVPDGAAHRPLDAALARAGRLARARGIVVVVSDFRDATDGRPSWEGALRRLAARHAVVAVEVRDPREDALPDSGQIAVVDPESGEIVHLDTSSPALRARFARAEADRRATVTAALTRAEARHVVLHTDRDWLRDLGRELR